MLAFALIPASLLALVTARLHHSRIPDDPYAFPKYRVVFLNGLPVLNETVQRWMQDGLRGGEAEFLDQPWEHGFWQSQALKSIEGVQGQQDVLVPPKSTPNHALELMKFGRNQYMCFVPPPPEVPASPPPEETDQVTPGHTWSLLQPLSGTCLYHRHGWFTYSYCHNSHVRQFRELMQPLNQRAGDGKIEEDPEWEAYTLGRAPPTLDPGADLTVAEEAALAANVELAKGSGSRYLVQRWGDGTMCDKTARPREIEVQFHCSMTTTDSIVFIKETQTCHYVLHIATPRICGVPGFKNPAESHEETYIRCREILDAEAYENADRTLPPANHPHKMPRVRPPPIAPPPAAPLAKEKTPLAQLLSQNPDILKKALAKLLAENSEVKNGAAVIMDDGQDEFVIEVLVDEDDLGPGAATSSIHDLLQFADSAGRPEEDHGEDVVDDVKEGGEGAKKDGDSQGEKKVEGSSDKAMTVEEMIAMIRHTQRELLKATYGHQEQQPERGDKGKGKSNQHQQKGKERMRRNGH
ncbi:hypothetical protein BXZ70DRAFT_916140 [Cristinia sonorae]|uniref:Protein OS-9 homolog n=1 Tax=Cristinia sonorae TaxID=1940300 RepID=A0A8K0V063_9AGAR|nr:hypothetical protein BXZ70DRAFT_916140 [Cristinia sonorae]